VSIAEAASTGERLKALGALRDRLAVDLDECGSARDVAALSQRLMDVLKQIDELGGGVQVKRKETGLSEFEKRLRDRESAPATARKAAGS
jgi:hypothetical protein